MMLLASTHNYGYFKGGYVSVTSYSYRRVRGVNKPAVLATLRDR